MSDDFFIRLERQLEAAELRELKDARACSCGAIVSASPPASVGAARRRGSGRRELGCGRRHWRPLLGCD